MIKHSLFTNKMLNFAPLFRGRVKDVHFKMLSQALLFKFAYDPNIKSGRGINGIRATIALRGFVEFCFIAVLQQISKSEKSYFLAPSGHVLN